MRTLALILLAVSLPMLAGCNTIRGMGQDVEAVGNAIQRSTR